MSDPRGSRVLFFLLLLLAVLFGPVAVGLGGLSGPLLGSLAVSLATGAFAVLAFLRPGRTTRLLLVLALALAIPVQYAASGRVIDDLHRPMADAALRHADASLFGNVFPEGELSVWLDRSPAIGPTRPAGRLLTEILQIAYVTYYFWGYGLLLLLAWRLVRRVEAAWPTMRRWLAAWVGAYLLNYVAYVLVPARGPWVTYPDLYRHPLEGLALTTPLRTLIRENMVTADCFPSGHTALSWIVAIAALRLAPRYGRIALAAALVITFATVALRFHYEVDVLAAIPLVLVGLAWGGFLGRGRDVSAVRPPLP